MINLNDIGIQNSLAENLAELIKSGRLPHAIMLRGGSETLRQKLSLFLAEAFVCEGDAKPCGKCSHCIKAQNGNHPDVITADPSAQGEKMFKIALVREIKDDAYIIPNEARSKVYILRSADKMNIQAQNALLKLIEEPPEYAIIFLLTSNIDKNLPTIISRCIVLNIKPVRDLFSNVIPLQQCLKQSCQGLLFLTSAQTMMRYPTN